jgi:hypothetical protein
MSEVTYRYEQSYGFKKKGVKHTIKEQVIDGPRGLTVKYLKLVDKEFYSMFAKEIEKNKFEFTEKKGDTETKEEIDSKTLMKKLKELKLTKIIEFITDERGTYNGKKVSKVAIKVKGY